MKETSGYMTVEAVILIPFLILITMVMIYFTIFIYDRALIVADVNSMVVIARNSRSKKEAVTDVSNLFEEIRDKHPYLSVEDIELCMKSDIADISIGIKGKWKLPLWSQFEKEISYEKKVSFENPVDIMYMVDSIEALGRVMNNAD